MQIDKKNVKTLLYQVHREDITRKHIEKYSTFLKCQFTACILKLDIACSHIN